MMKRQISSARACVKVLQSIFFPGLHWRSFAAGARGLSPHRWAQRESRLGAAWSGRSLPCLRSWKARLAVLRWPN